MRKLIFFFLLFSLSFSLFADWDVVEELFIPPVYYVGDSVLLQFRITLDSESELIAPSQLPVTEWLEIESIDVLQEGYDARISIRFRSFQTGTRTMPPLSLGDITLDKVKIFTTSLSEQNDINELRGIRTNFDFPGIKIIIGLFIIFLVAFPYLFVLFLRMIFHRISYLIRWILRGGPRRKISKLHRKLENRIDDNGCERDFFIELSSGIRTYLSEKTGTDYFSLTTRDMKGTVSGGVDRHTWNDLISLLKLADLVKFAGQRVTRKEKVWSLEVMKELIDSLEKEEHHANI